MKRGQLFFLVLLVLIAIGGSYAWNRWLEHDIAHDSQPSHK